MMEMNLILPILLIVAGVAIGCLVGEFRSKRMIGKLYQEGQSSVQIKQDALQAEGGIKTKLIAVRQLTISLSGAWLMCVFCSVSPTVAAVLWFTLGSIVVVISILLSQLTYDYAVLSNLKDLNFDEQRTLKYEWMPPIS